jgi:hypothetical protein
MLVVELAWNFKVLVDMINLFGEVNIAYCPLMIEPVKVFVFADAGYQWIQPFSDNTY